MDTTKQSLTVLSLCPGILGLERGIERALEGSGLELDVIAYVEVEAFIIANIIAGMESGVLAPRPVWANLKTFPWEQFHNKVHLFVGGYPCQPFSTAGQRQGTEDPRHLWPYIKEGISAVRPVCCFFENVRGHLSLGFEEVYADLRELGYEVRFGIYSAEEVGAPHKRERLFIMAIMAGAIDESRRLAEPKGQKQDDEISARRPIVEVSNEKMDDAQYHGSFTSKNNLCSKKRNGNNKARAELSGQFKGPGVLSKRMDRWPARPGEEQYDWEEPRVVELEVGSTADGNEDGSYTLSIKHEAYTTTKERAIEALHALWFTVESEIDQWTFGGLFCFLKEKILFAPMLCEIKNKRFTFSITHPEKVFKIQKESLRNLWYRKTVEYAPQRRELLEQLRIEFSNAMCVLSYQAALGRRKDAKDYSEAEAMQCLWFDIKNSCWNVPEALQEIKEIWRPHDDKNNARWFMEAYKSYRLDIYKTLHGYNYREDLLRAAGNGVVEQTAELAFIDLLRLF